MPARRCTRNRWRNGGSNTTSYTSNTPRRRSRRPPRAATGNLWAGEVRCAGSLNLSPDRCELLSVRVQRGSQRERTINGQRCAALSRRCWSLVLGLLLGGAALVLLPATPASAHAVVVAANPAQTSVIGFSPTEVSVTFSESISIVAGKAQVIGPDGERILAAEPRVSGTTLRIPVRKADKPLGTYVVSYRVMSADSHPIAGGYTFSVGAPSAVAPAAPDDAVHRSVAVALPVAKYLGYAGLVLLIGPTLMLALLWPRRLSRRGPIRTAYTGVALLGVGTGMGLWLQGPYASGASALDISAAELRQVLTTTYGITMLARLAVLAAVAALLPAVLRGRAGRSRAAALILLSVIGLATWPLSGHAGASPLPWFSTAAAVVHLAAMALWLGGLLTLVVFLLPHAHQRVLAVILPVWSRWAVGAVIWLVGGGVVQALIEVRTVGQLLGTPYGRFLTLKGVLLVVMLAAAAVAHRAVRRRTAPDCVRQRLRRTVGFEAATAAVILVMSALLVQSTPARSNDAEVTAAAKGVAGTLTTDLFTLQFDVYPVQLGENNTVHAFVYTAAGEPLPVEEWKLTAALPEKGIEPVTTLMLGLQPHHSTGAVTFPVAGTWELRFTARTSAIDRATVSTTITVPNPA